MPGARVEDFGTAALERALGPAACRRGAVAGARSADRARPARSAAAEPVAAGLLLALLVNAPTAHALESNPNPALATRLGYIATGDAQMDAASRAGLEGLSEYVNRRTAATWWNPMRSTWQDRSQLLSDALSADELRRANALAERSHAERLHQPRRHHPDRHGGAGSRSERFRAGTGSALQRVAQGLVIPPLAPLTTEHVLARAFYLLQDFPGRGYRRGGVGQRDQARANDSVSPVIIGGNDWAAAWAVEEAVATLMR